METNGRFRQDSIPTYPPPYHILRTRTKLTPVFIDVSQLSADEVFENFQHSTSVRYIFDLLRQLTQTVDTESSAQKSFWFDSSFLIYTIHPLLHELLSFPRATRYDSTPLRQRECIRLAAILYVCNIRNRLDPDPGIGMLYGTKLYVMLRSPDMLSSWSDASNCCNTSTFVWILTVAACSVTLFDDLRGSFKTLLSTTLRSTGIASTFRAFYTLIHRVLWSTTVLESDLCNLHTEFGAP